MATRPRRRNPIVAEVLLWLLFFALLVPAGVVGWAIGHYTAGSTHTRTVTVASPATTTAPPTTTTVPATTPAKTTPPKAAASPGKAVFLSAGCGACHTFAPAGTTAKVGPNLATAPAADAKKAHMPVAAFVRESIVKPNAYIAPGFPKGLMPQTFGKTLTKKQLDDLVAFITAK